MTEFPNNLRNIRKNHPNKTLRSGEEVARLMNLSKQYYYDLETGRNGARLNIDHLNQLTKIFNVSSDEILGSQQIINESNEPKKPKDLVKFLEQTEVMFDGETYELNDEDREKLKAAFEFVFWHAKQKNKRKKS